MTHRINDLTIFHLLYRILAISFDCQNLFQVDGIE